MKSVHAGIYPSAAKHPHNWTIWKVTNYERIHYNSFLHKTHWWLKSRQRINFLTWLLWLFWLLCSVSVNLIPKSFSHLLLEIISFPIVILLDSLPDIKKWYLPGLALILLSLNQFKSVFPKTSKLCITYAEFFPVS